MKGARKQADRGRLKGFIKRSKGWKRSMPGKQWREKGRNAVRTTL